MSSSALALMPATATKWTILNGSLKGSVRLMNVPEFTVGRSPDCELVIINDPKCSRKQARVSTVGEGCEVESLNEKNLVQVNGQEVERALLRDGDIVTFGETQIQFHTTSASNNPSSNSQLIPVAEFYSGTPELELVPPSNQVAHMGSNAPAQARPRPKGKPRVSKKAGNGRLYLYGVVGLIAVWLFLPTGPKKDLKSIRTEQQTQQDIEVANKLRDAAEKQSLRRVNTSVTARQAQENYIRGFRDYQKGQFERALFSFRACLALNPDHVLCNRYLRLGQRKFDETIQSQMILGRKYRDQNQFKACRSAFRNVMVMVKDANNRVYQEAKANFEACDALTQGRF